ncbi:neurobeachin-like protein 1 [Ctenocephalides felis]|uniref:neurobeachin-like protein 1 n=1 Tax=Ctenocephalides felis TaxID=7515 RepID=UPI000E6E18EE|nr:neurobeachin-like protein 1 [Ctenocephalides felis]
MPLRTKTTLDPHVRSFPSGMQDSVWGIPCCLKGQLGLACLLQEPVTMSQAKTLFEAGPSFRMLLANDELSEGSDLLNRLIFCFSPTACWDNLCIDLAPAHKYNGHVVAKICHTQHIQDVLNGIGGIHSLLPFLEFAGHVKDQDRNIMHLISHMSSSTLKQSPNSPDDMVEWEILPSSASMDHKLDQTPIAMFLGFFRNVLASHTLNQEQLLQNEGIPIIGALLLQCDSSLIDVNVLMAVQLLIESCKANENSVLLKTFYQMVVFNFKIWSRSAFHIRIGHIQYISTIIKEDRKYFRKKFGIQFFWM